MVESMNDTRRNRVTAGSPDLLYVPRVTVRSLFDCRGPRCIVEPRLSVGNTDLL